VKFISLNHNAFEGATDEHLHSKLFQITYCSGGQGYFRLPPQEFMTDTDSFYVVNPNQLHGMVPVPKTNFQNSTIRFELPGFEGHLLSPEIRLEPHQAAEAYGLLCRIRAKVLVGGEAEMVQAGLLLAEVLLILERGCRQQEQELFSPLVRQAIQYISEHFRTGMGILAVAEACGVSASHLSRAFRKETGDTPLAYLHRVRLGFVTEQLFRTNMKIADIAAVSGFESTKNLNMAFQRVYKTTPTAFRNRHLEDNSIDQNETVESS
jgi:AraC-like DNA-binding protein